MEERGTLARPYANAVFQLAREEDKLDVWSDMLGFLTMTTADPVMKGLIADPRLEKGRVADVVIEVGGGRLSDHGQNLVRVLAENGRLGLAPEIQRLYEEQRAASEKKEKVVVTAAYAVNPKLKKMIGDAMAQRLACEVEVETHIDRDLIGGAVIRVGDLVIDASLRGRLGQLKTALGG
jgi:F-type H+-transporting ATPase subunit delta